jgi:hypothetical protein
VSCVVFVGPSLRPHDAVPQGIEVRPPAARGDLLAAGQKGARVIGLIDGVFAARLAVSNTEVREAARLGARLFGASSMGALRAAECPDAMTGVGEIHRMFVSGELTDDDEVACLVHPETFAAMSLPLVQVRAAATLFSEREPGRTEQVADVITRMKRLAFDERTVRRLEVEARAVLGDTADAFVACVGDPRADLKRADAIELLRVCARAG